MTMLVSSHAVTLPPAGDGQREQWVHLLPAGAFRGRDGRGPYVAGDLGAVIDATKRYAGSRELVIDYDHQTENAAKNGQPAPAAGWVKDFQARTDGLWGLVRWTERAAAHLQAGEYRYLSPVFAHSKSGEVLCLLRAGLTNNPNLNLKALASAHGWRIMDDLTELRQLLGLPDDADMAAICAKVCELTAAKHSAEPDPARYVPMEVFSSVRDELAAVKGRTFSRDAEISVNSAMQSGKVSPAMRDWATRYASKDPEGFAEWVAKSPAILTPGAMMEGGTPSVSAHSARLSEAEREIFRNLGHGTDDTNGKA